MFWIICPRMTPKRPAKTYQYFSLVFATFCSYCRLASSLPTLPICGRSRVATLRDLTITKTKHFHIKIVKNVIIKWSSLKNMSIWKKCRRVD